MKKYYFGLLLLLTISAFGQDVGNVEAKKSPESSSFKMYPNPAENGVVYITTKHNSNKEVIIYDVFGAIVLRDRIASNTLNISSLVAGVYMLQVIDSDKTFTRKLVVK